MPEFSLQRLLFHPATLFVGCVIITVAGTVALWEQNSEHFLKSHRYDLTPERIQVSGNVELCDQLKRQVIDKLSGEANTLDSQLVPEIANLAESLPYVQQVSVTKSVSAVDIAAKFRVPIAVIELDRTPVAIDSEAMILDGRMYQLQTPDDFLRISLPQPASQSIKTWQIWPDTRVRAAAAVCAEIQHVWKEFGLYRVVSYWRPGQPASGKEVFELWTKYGDKIIWSNVIDEEEVSAEKKINAIREFLQTQGSLDKLAGRNKLDVRTGQIIMRKDVRTADKQRLLISKFQDFILGR